MENHKFKQLTYSRLCGICYKPKLDDVHLNDLGPEDIIPSHLPSRNKDLNLVESSPIVDGVVVPWNSKKPVRPSVLGEIPTPYIESSGQLSFTEKIEHLDNTTQSNLPDCYGHKCPNCGDTWSHSYKCWPDPKVKEMMHCPKCFGQAVVEIHRNDDIAKLINPQITSAKDLAHQRIEHEAFIVLEASKSANYEEWCADHIRNLRALIEQYTNKIFATNSALAQLRREDAEKLTPEELEQFRKNSVRGKKTDEEKKVKQRDTSKKDYKMMLANLIALSGSEKKAKKQLDAIWLAEGKEIPEL